MSKLKDKFRAHKPQFNDRRHRKHGKDENESIDKEDYYKHKNEENERIDKGNHPKAKPMLNFEYVKAHNDFGDYKLQHQRKHDPLYQQGVLELADMLK